MYRCTYCEYSTPYLHNLKRHEKNKHYKAPTNTLLQPKVAYSSTENRQHLTGYQIPKQGIPINGSGVLRTTQQYDPRVISRDCFVVDVFVMLFYCYLGFCYNIGQKIRQLS